MNQKVIIVSSSSENVHIESQRVDCDIKNGVYSYRDDKSDWVDIFVFDVDVSQEMFEAMRQYYYHVMCECDFVIPSSHLSLKTDDDQQLYDYFNEVLKRFLTYDKKYESHKSLDKFDYKTHQYLINQY